MQRRKFLSSVSNLSLFTATASISGVALAKSRKVAEHSIDNCARKFSYVKTRIDKLETGQKRITKGVMLLAAVSTGVDLTLIL